VKPTYGSTNERVLKEEKDQAFEAMERFIERQVGGIVLRDVNAFSS